MTYLCIRLPPLARKWVLLDLLGSLSIAQECESPHMLSGSYLLLNRYRARNRIITMSKSGVYSSLPQSHFRHTGRAAALSILVGQLLVMW